MSSRCGNTSSGLLYNTRVNDKKVDLLHITTKTYKF